MHTTSDRLGIIGFIFTGIAGVLLHFLYDITGESILTAPFSAVNESTWEHMKLLYFPLTAFAFIEYKLIGNEYEGFWCIKLIGTLTGLIVIPVIFYTVKGTFGSSPDWFNIAIFFIAAAAAFLTERALMKSGFSCLLTPFPSIALLILTGLIFVIFTFAPPDFPIFTDPINGKQGI